MNGLSRGITVFLYLGHPSICHYYVSMLTIAAEEFGAFLQEAQSLFMLVCLPLTHIMNLVKLNGSAKAWSFHIIVPQTVFSFIKNVYNLVYFLFLREEMRCTFVKASGSVLPR